MKNLELKILIPFLVIIIFSLGTVGIVSYRGTYGIFESILYKSFANDLANPNEYINYHLMELQKYTILVAIVAIIASSQMTIFFAHNITRPIKKLAMACDELSKGNFDVSLDYHRNDELGMLRDAFIRMATELEEYIQRVKEITVLNENIINSVKYGIIVFTPEKKIILINSAAKDLFQKNKNLESHILKQIKLFLENRLPRTGSFTFPQEDISKVFDYDINPALEGNFVLCFSDITEKEQLKKRMEHINRLSSVGEMSAVLAHEIRNPLQGIKSCLQVMESDWENNPQETLMPLVYKEIDRVNIIIANLLNFSRPPEPKPEYIDLSSEIQRIKPLLSISLKKKNISLKVDISKGAETLFIDSLHFRQIILNLVSNSMNAIGRNGNILITSRKIPHEILISISDDGKGVNPKDLSNIFNPFYSTSENGTGLGLAVVQNLVIKNHGYIEAFVNDQGGLTVTMGFLCDSAH